MQNSAQSALEYIMTYAWTLIAIALAVGVILFIISPQSSAFFTSSNLKTPMSDYAISKTENASFVLINRTGSVLNVTGVYPLGDFSDAGNMQLNNVPVSTISSATPLRIDTTEGMRFTEIMCDCSEDINGSIEVYYVNRFDIEENTIVVGSGRV